MQDMGPTDLQGEFAYTPDRQPEPFLILFIVAMTTEDPRPYPSGGIFFLNLRFPVQGKSYPDSFLTSDLSLPCHLIEGERNM